MSCLCSRARSEHEELCIVQTNGVPLSRVPLVCVFGHNQVTRKVIQMTVVCCFQETRNTSPQVLHVIEPQFGMRHNFGGSSTIGRIAWNSATRVPGKETQGFVV